MLLAIDVGNTHTVLGCYEVTRLRRTWRVSSRRIGTADELRAHLIMMFSEEGLSIRDFNAVVLSSVVPGITSTLREVFRNSNLRVIDHRWPFSFRIEALPPDQIGTDRLVNAEAAVRDYGSPVIIIDSGTATTLCAVAAGASGAEADGRSTLPSYLGGAIMPGMELSIDALANRAAKLFSVELIAPEKTIGTNTQQALRSGILYGYAGMIDTMVRRFKKEMGSDDVKVVATGGIGQRLQGLLEESVVYDSELTLRGIRYLHESARDL